MSIGTEIMAAPKGFLAGTIKPFVIAHPIGIAIVGGALIGAGAYYAMKKLSTNKEEATEEATAA